MRFTKTSEREIRKKNTGRGMRRNSANGTIKIVSSSGNSISRMLTRLPLLKLKLNACVSCLLSRAVKDRLNQTGRLNPVYIHL
jgi:hypothetical protein